MEWAVYHVTLCVEWAWSCHVTFVCGVGVAMCEGEVMGVIMGGSTVVTEGQSSPMVSP